MIKEDQITGTLNIEKLDLLREITKLMRVPKRERREGSFQFSTTEFSDDMGVPPWDIPEFPDAQKERARHRTIIMALDKAGLLERTGMVDRRNILFSLTHSLKDTETFLEKYEKTGFKSQKKPVNRNSSVADLSFAELEALLSEKMSHTFLKTTHVPSKKKLLQTFRELHLERGKLLDELAVQIEPT